VKLSGTGVLTRAGKALTDVWSRRIGNRFWDVLFDSLFQAVRRATNVPTVSGTQIGRLHCFDDRKVARLSCCKNNTWFNGKEAALHGRRDLLFKFHRNVSDPWNV